jgi:iron complex outermembrane receptor protein
MSPAFRGARRAPARIIVRCTFLVLATSALAAPAFAAAPAADSARVMPHSPSKYEVLVSATRRSADPINVPNGASVISGAELRGSGARTVADAIGNVVGLDTGDGSDNGPALPNIGMWGLKEFDALLITLDGVPVGGPFNPSLSQIDVTNIDRIEVIKGPQGTMYGASGFAGMIQMFSRQDEEARGHVSAGGGSSSNLNADAGVQRTYSNGIRLRLSGMTQHGDASQDRTGRSTDRGALSLARDFGKARVAFDAFGYRDDQGWGTPMPYESGLVIPGFQVDHNYAVSGARIEHRVLSTVARFSVPLAEGHKFESSLSYTRDNQTSLTSFPADFAGGDTVGSAGVSLRPYETTVYGDAHVLSHFELGGSHEWVTGAAITWGRTTASGIGFDFDQLLSDPSTIPGMGTIPVGDNRSFEDRRTFVGVYAHDAWTPRDRFTLSGGGRYDNTSEALNAYGQEVGSPPAYTTDSKTTGAWSGDLAAVVRLAPANSKDFDAMNLYGNWKSSFKPAAPNLTEAEQAEILEPERSHSIEGGLKLRAIDHQVEFAASIFQMNFSNMVVSTVGAGGGPELSNGGTERFKGQEFDLTFTPGAVRGLSVVLGYAHHDARFVHYTFVTPDSQYHDVSGNRLEMVPQELWNARVSYRMPGGLTLWGAARHQGDRPLNRRNTLFVDSFEEYDAGGSFAIDRYVFSIAGRNLGDDRHLVSESDIGDSQFYVAPPARVTAQITATF